MLESNYDFISRLGHQNNNSRLKQTIDCKQRHNGRQEKQQENCRSSQASQYQAGLVSIFNIIVKGEIKRRVFPSSSGHITANAVIGHSIFLPTNTERFRVTHKLCFIEQRSDSMTASFLLSLL